VRVHLKDHVDNHSTVKDNIVLLICVLLILEVAVGICLLCCISLPLALLISAILALKIALIIIFLYPQIVGVTEERFPNAPMQERAI